MEQATRRDFFRLIAGAAALTVVPSPSLAAVRNVARICGDGAHDDAPGLNALFRGEPVQFLGPARGAKIGWTSEGEFQMDPTLVHRCCETVEMVFGEETRGVSGGHLIVDHPGVGLYVRNVSPVKIQRMMIEGGEVGITIASMAEFYTVDDGYP